MRYSLLIFASSPMLFVAENAAADGAIEALSERGKGGIVSSELPEDNRGAVHTTVLSPDGRYVPIIGPSDTRPGH